MTEMKPLGLLRLCKDGGGAAKVDLSQQPMHRPLRRQPQVESAQDLSDAAEQIQQKSDDGGRRYLAGLVCGASRVENVACLSN